MRKKKVNVTDYSSHKKGQKFPPVLYGLQGIKDLFNVSKATASRYANSFLKDAVTKNGNVFIIDTRMALERFGVKNPDKFISEL